MVKRLTRGIVRNEEDLYEDTFRERGVKHIDHYPTATLHHPEAAELRGIEFTSHIWKVGDRYSKLAHKYYGDSKLWWILAWYNQLPTDSHPELGQVIYIPLPLNKILAALRG